MKPHKTIIVLLALLFAAMVMIPCISACEGSSGCEPGTKTTQFSQTPEIDLFSALGVEKPNVVDGPRWQPYASSKMAADGILTKAKNQMPPKHSVDAWISCSTTGVTGGNSVVSEWVSTGFGCFGTP